MGGKNVWLHTWKRERYVVLGNSAHGLTEGIEIFFPFRKGKLRKELKARRNIERTENSKKMQARIFIYAEDGKIKLD